MNDLTVDIEKGTLTDGKDALRLIVRREGQLRRGVYTRIREDETEEQARWRLVTYYAAHEELPEHGEGWPLTEI